MNLESEKPNQRRTSPLLKHKDICSECDEEDEFSDKADKTENGTQTHQILQKKGKMSQMRIQRCLIRNSKQIIPNRKPKKHKYHPESFQNGLNDCFQPGLMCSPKFCSTRCKCHYAVTHPRTNRAEVKLMDWKRFHRLSVIYSFIDELERDYPAICSVIAIGKSVEGRDIKMLKISNSDASNKAVWLDASIHSREWISAAVATYIADLIVKKFQNLSTSVTNKDWYVVPVLNPDGYEYTFKHDRMWRKNRANHMGTTVGVDLNRNFGYGWGLNDEEGSSNDPHHVFYRGPAPFSEPETAAVRDTILGSATEFIVFLSLHSYFELIIFPWGYKTDPCPDYLNLLEAGLIMSRAIYETSGLTYKVGSTKDLTYFACGTAIDWSYAIAKIPYSFMLELRSRKHKFRLPKDQIIGTCAEAWSAISALMDYVDRK